MPCTPQKHPPANTAVAELSCFDASSTRGLGTATAFSARDGVAIATSPIAPSSAVKAKPNRINESGLGLRFGRVISSSPYYLGICLAKVDKHGYCARDEIHALLIRRAYFVTAE